MASPVGFIQEVKIELGKVVWPSKKQATKLTALVIAIALAVGLFIGGLDLLFIKLVDALLR